jgi:sugar phosphate isomerase/epimerase
MQRILSTYRFINHILTPEMIAQIAQAGISKVEVFCASSHFAYRDPQTVRELAGALDEHQLRLHSLHSPTERSSAPGRESSAPISISDLERIRRQDAIDEVKRALEVAERIPFQFLVQHMATGRQSADLRAFDAAFSALEHLVVFAKHRGVTIAVENTPNELGSPESLQKFVRETHLHELRFCFDVGHAHIGEGVAAGFEFMRDRVVTTHIHDNHGDKDEHLLPYQGTVDWDAAFDAFSSAPEPLPLVLELKQQQSAASPSADEIRAVCDKMEQHLDKKGIRTASA